MGMIAKWVITKASTDSLDVQVNKVKNYLEQVQTTIPNDQATAVHYDVTSGKLHLMFSDKAVKDYALDSGLKVLADFNSLDSSVKDVINKLNNIKQFDPSALLSSISDLQNKYNKLLDATAPSTPYDDTSIKQSLLELHNKVSACCDTSEPVTYSDGFNMPFPFTF